MTGKVLEALTNNKFIAGAVLALLAWIGTLSGRVSAVETQSAVQAEQTKSLNEKIDDVKRDTGKILDAMLKEK